LRIQEVDVARTGALRQAVRIDSTAGQARAAGKVAEAMAAEPSHGLMLTFPDGSSVALPVPLVDLVRSIVGELASGRGVTVLPADTVVTPAEVAELLGLSRPFVVRLLDEGVIASERLPSSRHRRIRLDDVLAFAAQREQRREGRRRIGDAVADAGLPY